jgi:hypothetical protein
MTILETTTPSLESGAAAMRPSLPAGRTKPFYALGAIAFGVKDNGCSPPTRSSPLLGAYNITRASHAAGLEALSRRRESTRRA